MTLHYICSIINTEDKTQTSGAENHNKNREKEYIMNTINQVNNLLNSRVAYATKTNKRGGYELRFANTNKLIVSANNKSDFLSEVTELIKNGVQQSNSVFDISKNGTLKI